MARAIDAVQVLNDINWHHKPNPVSDFESGFNNGLNQAMWIITHAPTLTPQSEWVSVEERLPEKHSEYIVCACDEGEPVDERIWGDTVVVCADYYDGTFTWYEGNTEYDISDIVTHWMPLPAPPGKDNNVPTKGQNEPLTLEQLREMDGEPVYIVFSPDVDGEKLQFWALVAVDEWDDVYLANKDEWAFNYEEFLEDVEAIYRRPPEGEGNA